MKLRKKGNPGGNEEKGKGKGACRLIARMFHEKVCSEKERVSRTRSKKINLYLEKRGKRAGGWCAEGGGDKGRREEGGEDTIGGLKRVDQTINVRGQSRAKSRWGRGGGKKCIN